MCLRDRRRCRVGALRARVPAGALSSRGRARSVGTARELADSLYADLYGTSERDGERRSLFRYFHGRSSLPTWLRSVLAQRHVDAIRLRRRLEPLPEDDEPRAMASTSPPPADPDRTRYLALLHRGLKLAISMLAARDRLRLACYYTEQLTLAQTGRVLGEHEATTSRQLARTRRRSARPWSGTSAPKRGSTPIRLPGASSTGWKTPVRWTSAISPARYAAIGSFYTMRIW